MEEGRKYWYAAYVRATREKKIAAEINSIGTECYLPTRKCKRRWSDRIKIIDKLVIPRVLFIRATPQERLELLKLLPDRMRFMTEKGPYSPVVIPDSQMEVFQKMVSGEEAEIRFSKEDLSPGDKVMVMQGPLAGSECEMIRISGKNCIAARLSILGTATVEIPISFVEKIK